MVIDQNDLTEAIVPQAKHYIDQRVHDGLLAGHHCAGHAQVVIGVAAVVDRGQCEGYLMAGLGGLPADGLADGAAHEGVQAGVVVDAVVLRTANGDQDNVIFVPLLNDHLPGGGLDVAAGAAHLGVGGDAVVVQNRLDLLLRGIP